jgi:hypothetical protein
MKILVLTAALTASTIAVYGELFAFSAITSNDTNGYAQATGESQLFMDVVSLDAGQVSLTFTNAGPAASVVSAIYFDFAPELSLSFAAINNGPGVDFQLGPVKPKNLPGGQDLDNEFISNLGITAGNPKTRKGINPYEGMELVMYYDDSYDFLSALENEELRIGLHAQGFAGGYSESFINRTFSDPYNIPEPSTIPLLLGGAFILHRIRRFG